MKQSNQPLNRADAPSKQFTGWYEAGEMITMFSAYLAFCTIIIVMIGSIAQLA